VVGYLQIKNLQLAVTLLHFDHIKMEQRLSMDKKIKFLAMAGLCMLSACAYNNAGHLAQDRMAGNDDTRVIMGGHYTNNILARQTYDAVDRLIRQAHRRGEETSIPMVVATLSNIDTMEHTNRFGRVVGEQISSRLTQQGITTSELKLRKSVNIKQSRDNLSQGGEYILSRDINDIRTEYKVGYAVTGTYGIAEDSVMVNLKLIDIKNGHIAAATDYSVDINDDVDALIDANAPHRFYGTSMAY